MSEDMIARLFELIRSGSYLDRKKLEYFFEVARLKSFTKAAQTCFVSQTAISQQIAVLEKELGVELFIRDKKKVELTTAGEYFLRDTKRIVALYDNAVKKAREVAAGHYGKVSIGYFSMFDRYVLSPIIREFSQVYPEIQLEVIQCNAETIRKEVLNGNLDIGLVFDIDWDKSGEIMGVNVHTAKSYLCMHKSHPLAAKERITMEDVNSTSVLTFGRNDLQDIYDYNCDFNKNNPLPLTDTVLIENVDTAFLFLETGKYISFLPDMGNCVGSDIIYQETDIVSPDFECNAFYLKNNTNESLKLFLDKLQNYYHKGQETEANI